MLPIMLQGIGHPMKSRVAKRKWLVISIVAGLWIVFTVVYSINYVTVPAGSSLAFETVKFIFLSITTFGVIFSTLLSSFNSLEATEHIADKIYFDRIENSFAFMERWESDRLLQARDAIRIIAKNKHALSQNEIESKFASSPELERSVINFFNFAEEVYLSIMADRVNESFLKQAFERVFRVTYECFYHAYRAIYPNSSTMLCFEQLYQRWK